MNFGPDEKKKVILTFIDHIVPLSMLLLDLVLNRVHFYIRHLPITLTILTIYGFVNMITTKVSGVPVYTIMTWDSVGKWAIAFTLPLLNTITFTVYLLLTKWRTRKYLEQDNKNLYDSP